MKGWRVLLIAGCLYSIPGLTMAERLIQSDSTGLPGDHFSLEGALELFKKSNSPEEFEKMINAEDNKINNLDLNEDGEVDYVKVIDKSDNDAHAFILQAAVSETESQDVAVIELGKTNDENAVAQIVGDEDLYGVETIIEPTEKIKSNAGATTSNVVVNVWSWPAVRYVYGPRYTVWISPWGWRARPAWWKPWRPVRHHVYYGYRAPYVHRYSVVHTHRVVRAHTIYRPVRTTSVVVTNRHRPAVTHYRTTRSVQGRNREVTRTTTTVKSPRGNKVTRKSTKVKKRGKD